MGPGSAPAAAGRAGLFYGWWVALALSVAVFLSTGIRFAAGPFLKSVVADLGLDRGSFSLVVSLSLFLYGAFMPLVGRLTDRYGCRPVATLGGLVIVAALALTSRVTTFWEFALTYGVLLSLGLAATGHVVASATLARWFVRRRGTAVSLLSAASMAGMSLMVPLVMWWVLRVGWRTSYLLLAAATLLVAVPLTAWIVRDDPADLGLAPDGAAAPDEPSGTAILTERTRVADALGVPAFWQLAGGLFTCGFSMSLLSAHGVPMLTDHGFHPMTASSAIGLLGLTSIGGGLALGVLSDRYGRKRVLASVYLLRTVAFTMLFLVQDPAMLLVAAAAGGLGLSGSLAMTGALSGDIFGRLSVGSIFGLIFLSHQAGASLGAWLAGALFDVTGGYGAAFAIACTLLLVGAGLSLTIDEGGSRPVAVRPAAPQRVTEAS